MLTSTTRFVVKILLLACAVRNSSSAVSESCKMETAALTLNEDISAAADVMNQDVTNQLKICAQENKDSCEVKYNTDSFENACKAENGTVYTPSTTFQCKDGLYVSGVTTTYLTCIGKSCNTEEAEKVMDEVAKNATDAMGGKIEGVECSVSFSGAYSFLSFTAVAASMVMSAALAFH